MHLWSVDGQSGKTVVKPAILTTAEAKEKLKKVIERRG
jgi:hypothetical protein